MRIRSLIGAAMLLLTGFALVPPFASAEIVERFEGENHSRFMGLQVKERQKVMRSMASALKTLKAYAYAPHSVDESDVWEAQNTIEQTAGELYEYFPDGSQPGRTGVGKSRATQKIWKDWDGFLTRIDNLNYAAEDMREALGDGDPAYMQAGFREVAKACAACHNNYRVSKK